MRHLTAGGQFIAYMDRLTYIGHATTLIRLEGTAVLTDPMLRPGLGPLRRQGNRRRPRAGQAP